MHLVLGALVSLGLTSSVHATSLAPECTLHLTPQASAVTDGLNQATPPLDEAVTRNAAAGNLLFAPVNILQALQALYPADGPLRPELSRLLGLTQLSRADALAGMRSVNNVLNPRDDGTKLMTSVSLWANASSGFTFRPDYVEDLRRTFDAASESLDFHDPRSLDRVNGFVARKTEDVIAKLLDRLDPSMKAILITTLFIQGSWSSPFEAWATKTRPFRVESGGEVSVDMMSQAANFTYGQNDDVQVVQMHTSDGRATMEVYLPRHPGLREAFAAARLAVPQFSRQKVGLELPRFKLGWNGSIMKALDELVRLGQSPAVDGLSVSDVLHVTELEVWEQGFRGAAATAMMLESFSAGFAEAPIPMKVDHSFGLRILVNDGPKSVELFRGWVDKPESFTPPNKA